MQLCAESNVLDLVDRLVREALAMGNGRRAEIRIPYHTPVTLYSLQGEVICEQVVTRDLTPHGVGLMHLTSLKCERMLAEFHVAEGDNLVAEVDICWSNPFAHGWFVSGARFRTPGDV